MVGTQLDRSVGQVVVRLLAGRTQSSPWNHPALQQAVVLGLANLGNGAGGWLKRDKKGDKRDMSLHSYLQQFIPDGDVGRGDGVCPVGRGPVRLEAELDERLGHGPDVLLVLAVGPLDPLAVTLHCQGGVVRGLVHHLLQHAPDRAGRVLGGGGWSSA